MSRSARTPKQSRRPAAPRSAVSLAALLLLATGCNVFRGDGKATPESGATAVGPKPAAATISERCLGARWIDPAAPAGDADWAPAAVEPPVTCFDVTATEKGDLGVSVDSAFVLTSEEDLDADGLAALIRFEPQMTFTVKRDDATSHGGARAVHAAEGARYRIVPDEPLEEGVLLKLSLLDKPDGLPVQEWSFQTARPVGVVQTLPANQATGVPTNTGVELTFSHDGVTGVEERFHIAPEVKGSFETHKRTVVFVPEGLAPGTLYTVTLDPGVTVGATGEGIAEPYTFAFETARDEGAPTEDTRLAWAQTVWEQPTADAPILSVFGYGAEPGAFAGDAVAVTAYRFDDMDAFSRSVADYAAIPSWSWIAREDYQASADGLATAATFEARLEPLGEFGEYLVRFPEPLPAGQYLVDLERAGESIRSWLQITDVSAYVALSKPKTLVWAADAAAGGTLQGARVSVYDGADMGTTGTDGVLVATTPEGLVRDEPTPWGFANTVAMGSIVVADGDRALLVPLADLGGYRTPGMQTFMRPGDQNLYWRYVYTDRPLYHLTDTVRFWGVARPRDGGMPVDTLTVQISGGDYVSYDYQPMPIARTDAAVTGAGTFMGQLDLVGATPGFYNLEVRSGDTVLTSTSLEVRDFVKPAYKIDVVSEAAAVLVEQPVPVDILATFFDGSPVPLQTLVVTGGTGDPVEVTTDENGRATYEYVVPTSVVADAGYSGYAWATVSAAPKGAEQGDIVGGASLQVFPGLLTATGQGTIDDDGLATLTGQVYEVDLSRLNQGLAADVDDFLGDPAEGRAVTVRVTEYTYDKVKTGEAYDPVAKQTRDVYRYDQVETPLGPFEAESGAGGSFTVTFPTKPEAGYQVALEVTDEEGRACVRSAFVGNSYAPSDTGDPQLELERNGPFSVGDTVAVDLKSSAGEALPDGDKYLFALARNGVLDQVVQDRPRYELAFDEDHVPNVDVIGVRYTGRTFQESSWPAVVDFREDDRALSIVITPDRDRYAPGEKASLTVRATDPDGKPRQAAVLLSAVDEAVYRAQGPMAYSSANILASLYATAPAGLVRTYPSHQMPTGAPAAEGGGGGDGRSDFRDVALFEEVTTDADGVARTTFDLPDNLTAWRVQAQGVTDDLYAGSSTASVPVGLPIFADVTMNDEYLTSDRPFIQLRAYGDALAEGDDVQFEVTSDSLLDQPIQVSGKAFEPVDVALPELAEGRHELAVTVRGAGEEDTLVRPLTAIPSRLSAVQAVYSSVDAGSTYEPPPATAERATLTLSDANRGRYGPMLDELVWTSGDRLDQLLSRFLASQLRVTYFGAPADAMGEFHPGPYQTDSGGLSLFPYSSAELDLSARAVGADPTQFGREALVRYFSEVANDREATRERVITALYGLATLGQPVLAQLGALASSPGDEPLSVWERLDLGLAFASAGDQASAFEVYQGLVAEFGEARGDSVRLNVGGDQDDVLRATARAAVLGALLGDGTSPALFDYTEANATEETLVLLEQIAFLRQALPRLAPEPVTFEYTLYGQRTTETLDDGRAVELSVSPDELAALDLEVAQGSLGVASATFASVDAASLATDPEVVLSREYELNGVPAAGDGTVQVTAGDDVLVRLRWTLGDKAVDGCYQISDLLPSGLRPVTEPYRPGYYYEDEETWLPYAIVGQRVSFCVTKDGKEAPAYRARVLGKGTYTAEPAVIQAQAAPESIAVTSARPFEIR